MKSALFFILLSAFIVAISCEPVVDDEIANQPAIQPPWYNSYSYFYTLCRLRCRQNCLEQGYWRGVCKQGECFCYGPVGPAGNVNGLRLPNY